MNSSGIGCSASRVAASCSACQAACIGPAQLDLLSMHAVVHGAEAQRLPHRCWPGFDSAAAHHVSAVIALCHATATLMMAASTAELQLQRVSFLYVAEERSQGLAR